MNATERNERIRNIAIIAHVDHGKTTLVDAMFRQSGLFRDNQHVDDRVMDSMDLERERGITIAAKNCAVMWDDVKINIIDTPGHADFGGEVERALSMVDGAILLVDASEGPLPQTRFVLHKALSAGLPIIVVINKIDRKDARPVEVVDEVVDLFIDLDATDEQIDFPLLYAIGREGIAKKDLKDEGTDLSILFDIILKHIPAPSFDPEMPFQMLVADLGYSEFLGRMAIGKVFNGSAKANESLVCISESGMKNLRVSKLQVYEGLRLVESAKAETGDIIVLSGIENVTIGDSISQKDNPKPLPRITVDEPTVAMTFSANTSPLAGKEGEIVQASKIYERLERETLKNVAIRVEKTKEKDAFLVKGRGEFQLAILIEQMRREGFELSVGRPTVITREEDGKLMEPIEHIYIDCEESFIGVVTEKLSLRKGRLVNLVNKGSGRVRIEFTIPTRGLIGYRDEFLSDTKGTGIINGFIEGYEEHRGELPTRWTGSIVADRSGNAVPYALFHLEPRGRLFIAPGEPVYEGMIIGEYNKESDLDVNPVKEKQLTNVRASGKDDAVILRPVQPMTLEKALHVIAEDEMVEATPKSIRLRKKILSSQQRAVIAKRVKAAKRDGKE